MKLWLCRKVDVTGADYVQWDQLDAERQILHFYLSRVQTIGFNVCVVERTEVIKAEKGPWGRWENKLLNELGSEEQQNDGRQVTQTQGKDLEKCKDWRDIPGGKDKWGQWKWHTCIQKPWWNPLLYMLEQHINKQNWRYFRDRLAEHVYLFFCFVLF